MSFKPGSAAIGQLKNFDGWADNIVLLVFNISCLELIFSRRIKAMEILIESVGFVFTF